MKILMLGWELPPHNSGGLGVACQNIASALVKDGVEIIFVLPRRIEYELPFCKVLFASEALFETKAIVSLLFPYATPLSYEKLIGSEKKEQGDCNYASDLFGEVARYAHEVGKAVSRENFDVIHAHDWLSFPAAVEVKRITSKPLVVHIHSTELDRTGNTGVNQRIYDIEKMGMNEADVVIAVSNFTKNKIVQNYGINPEKIKVVHNAVDCSCVNQAHQENVSLKLKNKKIVLFLGRVTIQKGPDYFVKMAKKVLDYRPDTLFIIGGSGDMERQIIEEVARLGITENVLFAGFLRGQDWIDAVKMADLYVMPSVSEPFGLIPLETLSYGTPVLVSRQCGVSEILNNALKTDFWDIDDMADKIISVLDHKELHASLLENGREEVKRINWRNSSKKCLNIYKSLIN